MSKHGAFFKHDGAVRADPARDAAARYRVKRNHDEPFKDTAVACRGGIIAPGDELPEDAFEPKTRDDDIRRLLRLGVIERVREDD